MAVEKASMNEKNCLVLRKHDIWLSGKVRTMKPEAKTKEMEKRTDLQFWPGILRTDHAHYAASGFGVKCISH